MLHILGRDRVHWLVVAGLIAACNGMAINVLTSVKYQGIGGAILGAFGVNPIFWFVMFAAAAIAFEPGDVAPTRRVDSLIAGAVFAMALSPIVLAASAGLLLATGWLLMTSPRGSRGRRAALVLLALTTSLIWGPMVMTLFGDRLVSLDAQFIALLAGTRAQGNLVDFSTPGNPLMIAYGCSSLHNITMALQLWVAITQQLRLRIERRVIIIGLAAVIGNILVNGVRIATIANHRSEFDYWHHGGGGSIFGWLAVVVVAVIVVLGCHALAPRRI
jgi:exosortase/archaeosortase family protein